MKTADWNPEVVEIILQWEASKCAESAGWCHYEAVLAHRLKAMTIRGDIGWLEEERCHPPLQEKQEGEI